MEQLTVDQCMHEWESRAVKVPGAKPINVVTCKRCQAPKPPSTGGYFGPDGGKFPCSAPEGDQ
jgi:hypothetical protein